MIKHNKKKNASIVYEQLMTLAARLIAQKNLKEYNFVMAFVKEHFSPNSELGKERKILSNLVEGSCREDMVAELFSEVSSQIKMISAENLDKQKNAVISKITKEIGADLFKIPIKDYKLHASAQVLLSEEVNGYKYSTPEERVKIKRLIKENLIKSKAPPDEIGNIDNFTYKVLISKYNKKYGEALNEHQKELVSAWLKYVVHENDEDIKKIVTEKKTLIESKIKESLRNKEHKVSDYYELLKEAQGSLKEKDYTIINEDNMYEMLRFLDLCEELEESENSQNAK